MEKRIMVTGCGGPASINFTKSLRDSQEKMHIVGVDSNKYYIHLSDADKKFIIPKSTESGYIDAINEIIKKESIGLLHPQPDIEVKVVSENREKINAPIFLPKKKTIEICQDKFVFSDILKRNGILTPKTFLIKTEEDLGKIEGQLKFPYWLRAKEGAGGKGSTLVQNTEQGKAWIKYWRFRGDWDFIAQEYLPGRNIAFQSLWKDGELVTSQARERIEYIYPHLAPSGITGTPGVAVTVSREDINKIATDTVLAIDKEATGIFCVDMKENESGQPVATEINVGRFFTTSYFFTKAGINMPYYYVKLAYKESIPELPKYNAIPAGIYWIRHIDAGYKLVKNINQGISYV